MSREKFNTCHGEISLSCSTQECDNVKTSCYPISVLLSRSSSCLREVKNKTHCQTFSYKRGYLREVVAYKVLNIMN